MLPSLIPRLLLTALMFLLFSTQAGADAKATQVSEKDATESLLSGAAWDQFAEHVKQLGDIIKLDGVPRTELEVSEGYRFLLAQLASEIDVVLHQSDLGDPLLRNAQTKFRSLAMPSSNAKYLAAEVEDSGVYRLWGKMGTATGNKSLQFYSFMNAQASWNIQDFVDTNNNFDIQLGGKPPPKHPSGRKNWVPVPEGATLLNLREYFSDWDTEERSQFFLDRLDRPERVPALSAEKMAGILEEVNQRVTTLVPLFMSNLVKYRVALENKVLPATPIKDMGLKDNIYGPGWFKLADDEAMVLTVAESDAYYWSVQLGNFWGEAIDFVNYSSSITGAQAQLASDGNYWLVIAKQFPGVPNWIDTGGHNEGMVFTRFQGISQSPAQAVQIVKLDKLRDVLPKDSPSVSWEEQRDLLRKRQDHMVKRWAR